MSSLSASYDRVGKLGEGTYGIVYKAKDKRSEEIVALKRMVPVSDAEGIPGTTMREIAFLRELKHPNIVDLKDIVFDVPKLTLVFECCEMDLAKYLKSKPNRQPPGEEIRYLMRQFLQGLAHMHSKSILHRDLKPHNLLLLAPEEESGPYRLKVADFGLARIHGIPVKKYRHDAVTLWYRPPDLLLGSIMYGFSMDVWSAGCIFAEMIAGCVLFQGKTEIEQLALIFDLMGYPAKLANVAVTKTGSSVSRQEENGSLLPQPPAGPSEQPQSPRPSGAPNTTSTGGSPMDYFNNNSAQVSVTASEEVHDPMPSFHKLPNYDAIMEKGILQAKARQMLGVPSWKPGFTDWVKKHDAVRKVGEDGVDLLRCMLELEPSRRISAAEALRHPFLSTLHQSSHATEDASIRFPPEPLSAYQMLWPLVPSGSADYTEEDFLGPDLSVAAAAVEAGSSFLGRGNSIRSGGGASTVFSGAGRIPVPPKRGSAVDHAPLHPSTQPFAPSTFGGTVIPTPQTTADGYSTTPHGAPSRIDSVGTSWQNAATLPQGAAIAVRGTPSGSWATHQDFLNHDHSSPYARREHPIVQLDAQSSDQEVSAVHGGGASTTGFSMSVARDSFLQSYGPHNMSSSTDPASPTKLPPNGDGRMVPNHQFLAVSGHGEKSSELGDSPAPPASSTTTATPPPDELPEDATRLFRGHVVSSH